MRTRVVLAETLERNRMAASDLPWLGERLRVERQHLGLTLRGLAREVGISASMMSQIETSKTLPSMSKLHAITSALGIAIEDVLNPVRTRSAPMPHDRCKGIRGRRCGPVVRPAERPRLTLDSGVTWELLGDLPPYTVDFLRVTYPPGGTSSSNGRPMRHPASQFGILLTGQLTLTLGCQEHRLVPGDAISFESDTPHGYRNDGSEPAVGVWFVIANAV
jgi:transcriptional regulator with XRE-family HTH domain